MEGRSRVLCKYFMHGACLKGDDCLFSHSWSDQASNICTFYQRGICSFGSRCRYDHVKMSRPLPEYVPPTLSRALPAADLPPPEASTTAASLSQPTPLTLLCAWQDSGSSQHMTVSPSEGEHVERPAGDLAERPICAFAAAGVCLRGNDCPQLHGDMCSTCGKLCLHPFRPAEAEEHKRQCEHNQKKLEALRNSQEIECCVCLERVLSKPTVAGRKFGLMAGCDHPFCIGCIRGWRSGSHAPGMDLDTVVRACPVCRVSSHFVVPSVVWYSSSAEKEEIINGYKNKLSNIDCRYFDYGNGACPFGTSCFYKHGYKDGRLEEVKLRHLGAADGNTVIAKNVRLSDFLARLNVGTDVSGRSG